MKKNILKFTLMIATLGGCVKTKFAGTTPPPASAAPVPPAGSDKKSPPETDPNVKKKICADGYRALRVAFVVDNSGSNGDESNAWPCQSATAPNLNGTDPKICGSVSIRGKSENYTDRQNALYSIISKMLELDKKARTSNPEFLGSEVGLSYFPDDNNGALPAKIVSGSNPALPTPMTPLKSIALDAQSFSDNLWTALEFTQKPHGLTPYGRAMESAKDLLKKNRDVDEVRPDVVFFLTDGLPTDQKPSFAKAIKAEIAASTKVYFLTTYKYDPKEDSVPLGPKMTTKDRFVNLKWGQEDGYGPNEFERYWTDLLALPSAIADASIEIQGSKDLKPELEKILSAEQTCQ